MVWAPGSADETQMQAPLVDSQPTPAYPAPARPAQGVPAQSRQPVAAPREDVDEIPVPRWSAIPGTDAAAGGASPAAAGGFGVTGLGATSRPAPVAEPEPPSGFGVAWSDLEPASDEDDDDEDDEPLGRSYSAMHMVVLLLVALVLGALIFLLMDQASGGGTNGALGVTSLSTTTSLFPGTT